MEPDDLPPPAPRRALHRRSILMQGYSREDGLWDIEGELLDTKDYGYVNSHGEARGPGDPCTT